MAYLSQTIVFILALMGTLFKSIKTDEHGNTLYSSHGLPLLTAAGKAVVILLTFSFVTSLYTTWSSSNEAEKKEQNALAELKKLQEQNEATKKQLTSLITDIHISFKIKISLRHRYLASYGERLSRGVREFLAQKGTELEDLSDDPIIGADTNLFPRPNDEKIAFSLLNGAVFGVHIYKKTIDPKHYVLSDEPPDFHFPVIVFIAPNDEVPLNAQRLNPPNGLLYDRNNGTFKDDVSIKASDIPVNQADWVRNDKIASVADLSGANVVIALSPQTFPTTYLSYAQSLDLYKNNVELEYLFLNVSGGHRFTCDNLKGSGFLYFCTLKEW